MFRRTIGTLSARLQLISDLDLIYEPRYFQPGRMESLLTDFGRIEDYDACPEPDGTLLVFEEDASPSVVWKERVVLARGPFTKLEAAMADKRYTLFGNQGLVYRYLLYLLEQRHGIHSFHANALYDEASETLTVVLGGAASGKSPALLAGVARGRAVFGTELVHLQLYDGGYRFYKSSAIDNIRLQSLVTDFPELVDKVTIPRGPSAELAAVKFPLDLSRFGAQAEVLANPRVRFVLPRVEAGRAPAIVEPIGRPGELLKLLFDNASEKVASSFTMYNRVALPGFDTPGLARGRLAALERFVAEATIVGADTVLAPPRCFLEVL